MDEVYFGEPACIVSLVSNRTSLGRSFDEAVVRAVNLNGDADSFGSMAGGMPTTLSHETNGR